METKKKKQTKTNNYVSKNNSAVCSLLHAINIFGMFSQSSRETYSQTYARFEIYYTACFQCDSLFFPSRRAVLWRDKLLSVVSRRTIFRSRNTLRWVAAPSFWNIFKRVTWHFGAVYVIRLHDPLRVVLWTAALINQNQ